MPSISRNPITTIEATVTSKGQVTLPSELRKHFGIQKGSRVRFSIRASGAVQVEPVHYELEDLWRFAESGRKPGDMMSFQEMNAAKARRCW